MTEETYLDDVKWFWQQIDKLVPISGSRAMAVRWWIQSTDCLDDIGFFCALWGIRPIEAEIRELVMMSDEMIASGYPNNSP